MADSLVAPSALVVQHNALVNARFDLNTHETRMFLAMLARLQRTDDNFSICQLLVRDIVPQTNSKNVYDQLRRIVKEFASRTITIEKLSPDGQVLKKPSFTVIPILSYATYLDGEGMIEAQFNDLLLPYLLKLRDNFTKAQLAELLKLKSPYSYRIYWLLREYATFGKRSIRLTELKAILGLSSEYDRFNNFRVRVLNKAQAELANTDLPFTYQVIKDGREAVEIKFFFTSMSTIQPVAALPASARSEWEEAVLAAGVSAASLPAVQSRLTAGDYDLGYVHYVLNRVKRQVKEGKVKKEGGAVFKALTEAYLLTEYQKARRATPTGDKLPTPAQAAQRKRLLNELEDAKNSLEFIQTSLFYTDETRKAPLLEVQQKIAYLEKQLNG